MIRIDVSGFDEEKWGNFKSKFLAKLYEFMETELDPIKHTTIKEEIAMFTNKLLEYGKAKLSKPVIDNDKTIAEIEELYSRRLLNIAETRKTNAEADAIEMKNKIKKFKLLGTIAKVIIGGKDDQESAAFTRDIENFLIAMNSLEEGDTAFDE